MVAAPVVLLLASGCETTNGYRSGTGGEERRARWETLAGDDVIYQVAADRNWGWDGFIESIYYPDYSELGDELVNSGAISNRIMGQAVQGAVIRQFQDEYMNWAADGVDEAGLLAMVYVTVEREAPKPPVIRPVTMTSTTSFSVSTSAAATMVGASAWESMFASAGVGVTINAETSHTHTYWEESYYEAPPEYRGYHSTIAIEVYYLENKGAYKETGKSALAGMAYFYSEQAPSQARLEAVARVLVDRLQQKGDEATGH